MHIDDPVITQIVFHPRPESSSGQRTGIATQTASGGDTIGGYLHLHPDSRILMIYFHGNGEIAAEYEELAQFFLACGVCFWVVDYRGYGRSTGTPAYSKMFPDAEAVFQDIQGVENLAARSFDHVMVMGRSLGSASAIYLAANHPQGISALVLDSPFADGAGLIQRIGGPELSEAALSGVQDNIELIESVYQPCRIIHGVADWIIPVTEADALYKACPSPNKKLVKIEAAGHNDLLVRGFDTYFSELTALIHSAVSPGS